MKTPALETARLILRPVTLEDAPAIQKHFAHWDIIKNLGKVVPWPYPEDGALIFLRDNLIPRIESGDTHAWAITLKEGNGEAVGLVDFRISSTTKGNRGFWIGLEYQRQGLMTEALTPIQDFIFNELNVESFIVCNAEGNIGSRRVKKKTGAEFLDYIHLPHHNGTDRSERWIVTKESWLKTRKT
ncbi:MAG: GNAT family N-acetyltransferase [Alphaproteobacteria bacterium]|nr:GNAT family N-acetyltransferase [Alphaproteobacteria bacterium]